VWSGDDPVLLRNVRYLAAGCRGWEDDDEILGKVAESAAPGMSLAQVEAVASATCQHGRSAVLALLWSGRCRVDLTQTLGTESLLIKAST
jgi:hypothetical protein